MLGSSPCAQRRGRLGGGELHPGDCMPMRPLPGPPLRFAKGRENSFAAPAAPTQTGQALSYARFATINQLLNGVWA